MNALRYAGLALIMMGAVAVYVSFTVADPDEQAGAVWIGIVVVLTGLALFASGGRR